MDAHKVLGEVVRLSGQSKMSISRKLGRHENYLSSRINQYAKSVPKVDTLAAVSDICGYDLLLRNREDGQEIVIDPPKRE